jgi:hypothetical protein
VLGQVVHAGPDGGHVFTVESVPCDPAVHLERPHGGHDDGGGRGESTRAALDVHELLGSEVGGEARFRHHDLAKLEGQRGGEEAVAAVSDVAEGPPVDEGGCARQRLHQVWLDRVLEKHGQGPGDSEVGDGHQRPVGALADHDAPDPGLEVVEVPREAQDGHQLGGRRDFESRLARHPVRRTPETHHEVAQGAVVHVEHPLPGDPSRVESQRVAVVQVIVDEGGQEIVGSRHRVKIAGEVQIDVFHRHDLGVAPAGGPALDPEARAQGRLADRDHGALAEMAQRVAQPHCDRRFALAGRSRRHARHQHEGAIGPIAKPLERRQPDLGLVVAVELQVAAVQAEAFGDHLNRLELRLARDLEVARPHQPARRPDEEPRENTAANDEVGGVTRGRARIRATRWRREARPSPRRPCTPGSSNWDRRRSWSGSWRRSRRA